MTSTISKHWFTLDTEGEYMPSKNMTCPICGDELNPPTPHSCRSFAGTDVTYDDPWESRQAPEPEPDYPTIDEVAWEETETEINEDIFSTMDADDYMMWLDAQNEEAGRRYDARGGRW